MTLLGLLPNEEKILLHCIEFAGINAAETMEAVGEYLWDLGISQRWL
jgi:hypothetical protein